MVVTDPTHPLFGRRFPLRSVALYGQGAAHVFVAYRGEMTLRLPVQATNLTAPLPSSRTKLTHAAIADLVALAEGCEGLWLPNPAPSGGASHQTSRTASSTNSPRSSVR